MGPYVGTNPLRARASRRPRHGGAFRILLMKRLILALLSLVVVGLAGGFIAFAVCATSAPEPEAQKADAIVVVTGGEDRISAALGLLRHGGGRRLLISGVNPRTSAAA